MKWLFCSDLHLADRLGNYRSNCLMDIAAKFDWLLRKAELENCNAIFFGGDWVDSARQGYKVQSVLIDLINSTGIPIFSVLGQHDIHGHEHATYKNSPVGIFDIAESYVTLLTKEETRIQDLTVSGVWFSKDAAMEVSASTSDIVIVHQSIFPDTEYRPFGSTFEDIGSNHPALILAGDLHEGYGIQEPWGEGAGYLVCPGSITRTLPKQAKKHLPKYVIGVGTTPLYTDTIPHKLAAEVFDMEAYEADVAAVSKHIEDKNLFSGALKELVAKGGGSVNDFLQELSMAKSIDVQNKTKEILEKIKHED